MIFFWKAEHYTNDGERKVSAKILHQVYFATVSQPIEQSICDAAYHRPHGLDAAPLKGLIHQSPKMTMLRIILAQHVKREKTERTGQHL